MDEYFSTSTVHTNVTPFDSDLIAADLFLSVIVMLFSGCY